MSAASRTASLRRATSESTVELELDLDGTGRSRIDTTVPFFDHMLTALGKHALLDLTVRASGDTDIDAHHTVEDTAIVLGQALRQALGERTGIARFGDATVPLDEALAQAVVDVSGRPYFVHTGEPAGQQYHLIGGHFAGSLTGHALESIATHAAMTVHVRVLAGRDPAKARALLEELDPQGEHHVAPLAHFAEPTDFAFDDRTGCFDLVVNASPLDMAGQPPLDFDFSHVPPGSVIYDIVTHPLETPLLRAARDRGFRTIDGLSMLIGQAAEAFEKFFGVAAPREHDAELRALLTS